MSSFHIIIEKVKTCTLSNEKLFADLIKDSVCYEPYYNSKNKKKDTLIGNFSSFETAIGIAEQFKNINLQKKQKFI